MVRIVIAVLQLKARPVQNLVAHGLLIHAVFAASVFTPSDLLRSVFVDQVCFELPEEPFAVFLVDILLPVCECVDCRSELLLESLVLDLQFNASFRHSDNCRGSSVLGAFLLSQGQVEDFNGVLL